MVQLTNNDLIQQKIKELVELKLQSKKKEWIESQIKKGYNDIAFFDDSGKNREAVEQIKDDYPEINLYVDEQPAQSKRIRIKKKRR